MTDVRLRVLIADDDASVRRLIEVCVEREGHVTLSASDGQEAVDLFRRERPDFAILDLWMPRLDGLQAMSAIHQEAPRLPVLIITGDATIPRVIEAVRQGAYDFVAKPLDLNHLSLTIRQTAEHVLLQRRVTTLAEQLNEIYGFGEVAANSAGMKRAVRLLRQAATSNATVLLLGESGTGKGLLAHELHRMGPRAHGPFVAVNCAAIPEQLLESELFGHEKGAFTGADARRIGKFEAAQGGAVFLDEIGEMAPGMQAKLLRVLQEREVVRVGSNTPLPLDVRVVAATNADLEGLMTRGLFRRDLYYRLAVIEVQVPPLRERREDIETLVAQFLRRAAEEEKKPVPAVDPEAMEALRRFDFPGNVRELENVVTRAVIFCDGALLRLEDLPPAMRAGEPRRADTAPASGDGGATPTPQRLLSFADAEAIPPLADIELAAMRRAVELCGGNMALAARRLHIGRATLYRRIHHVETGNG